MGALALALSAAATTAANNQSSIRFLIPSHAPPRRRRRRIINLSFPRKPTSKFIVFASKDNPKLDPWDQIEFKPLDIGSSEKRSAANAPLETKLMDSNIKFSMEALLQGKPKRLDQPVKGMPNFSREDMAFVNPEIYGNVVELENFLATSPIKEHEDNDWTMVEDLARTGGREEVKLISSSTRGFVAKLSVGDVVTCCIKKITYFGIFVEVEGVTALIHPTQVSWDATLDHTSYFRVGKIVKAKVHRLDFSLERIFLSLKETTVYMASMFENENKLLARSGNRVQELKWVQKRIDLIGCLLLLCLCICLHLPNWPCWMVIYVATLRWSLDLDRHLK